MNGTHVEIISASVAAPDRPNEDYALVGPTWVVLLDGATPRPGVNSGCIHGVPWLVSRLATDLARTIATEPKPDLVDALASAIDTVRRAHGPGCDLNNPDSPSATVAILRQRCDGDLDYLVLGDSPIILDDGGVPVVIADQRSAGLPSYTAESVRAHRNQPHGFWIASTKVEAAEHAVTGRAPGEGLQAAAVLTDGMTRYVDRLGMGTWRDLLNDLTRLGPTEVVDWIRAEERAQLPVVSTEPGTGRHLKRHDDATAVLWLMRSADASRDKSGL